MIIRCVDKELNLVLRAISVTDIENLRAWKNANRKSFFYQEFISASGQKEWFEKYCKRQNDHMFIVEEVTEAGGNEEKYHSIGCMAFRLEDHNTIDLYNIIRGQASIHTASMKDAMHLMLNYVKECHPDNRIKCDVLKDNPAVLWYKKCGFAIYEEREYYIMGIGQVDIPRMEIVCSEEA